MATIGFTINNRRQTWMSNPTPPLLWVVHEHLKLIANAMFQLTGKRLRHLPMSPDRVKKALA